MRVVIHILIWVNISLFRIVGQTDVTSAPGQRYERPLVGVAGFGARLHATPSYGYLLHDNFSRSRPVFLPSDRGAIWEYHGRHDPAYTEDSENGV